MLKRTASIRDSLSAAERRVADWVLAHPHKVVGLPLAKIAAEIGVSDPTVVRFCRSVGAAGFTDFKVRIAQNLASRQFVHADVRPGDDTGDIVAKVMGRSIRELTNLQQRLDTGRLEQAAAAMASAQRIDFYGIGASGSVVQDAQNKFFRLGLPCVAYHDSPTIRQAAAITDAGYAVVAVSKTGRSMDVVGACRQARTNGARVIAITSPLSPLARAAEIAILVDIDEDTGVYTPMSSRLAQLAVLDVIQVAFALRLGRGGSRKLELAKNALLPA
jgi:RpiR family carbohydrate utilization transcriptional regulator